MDTLTPMDTTERDLLMLSLKLRLMLIPIFFMEDMVLVTMDSDLELMDTLTPMDTIMERDPLMLNLRPMLTPTSSMVDTMVLVSEPMATVSATIPTDMPTTDKSRTNVFDPAAAKEQFTIKCFFNS